MTSADQPLRGRTVLVTRPAPQAGPLADQLRALGAEPLLFPTLAIEPLTGDGRLAAATADLAGVDIAIFVSLNAVAYAWPTIAAAGGFGPRTRFAAVGQATAQALRAQGVAAVESPIGQADSEALLALPVFQGMNGRRVMLFAGLDGRTFLADTLRDRGADVTVVPCYRRSLPATSEDVLVQALGRKGISAVTTGSAEGLRNLYAMVGGRTADALRALPHFVNHPKVAEAARACGVADVVVAGPTDNDMVRALCEHFAGAEAARTP